MTDDRREVRQVFGALAVLADALNEIRRAHALPLGFAVADEINVGNYRLVRLGKTGGEVIQQKPRAAVLMWLKDTKQPARLVFLANCLERCTNFRRVMPVVIDHD